MIVADSKDNGDQMHGVHTGGTLSPCEITTITDL